MRIGLFTDTYHPAMNGIVHVVESTRSQLESLGHEVFVFCPKVNNDPTEYDDHVIRFRSIPSGLFDDNRLSVFFPPVEMRRIRKLDLDVIHFFTPLQIGMMGIYAAQRTDAILVGQHCTDFYQYVEFYPQVLPGVLALTLTLPFTVKFDGIDTRTLLKSYRPQLGVTQWSKDVVENLMALVYSRCDAVVAVSRKSQKQLEGWRKKYQYDVALLPTGVDPLPKPTAAEVKDFRKKWNIAPDDLVFTNIGRIGIEKNLAILIPTLRKVLEKHANARLMFVGDFDYLDTLKELAADSGFGDRITFTGRLPRQNLGVAYAAADVFVFPSVMDTQGLVVHEAANAGLPIVYVDRYVTEVVIDGENGYVARNSANSIAEKIIRLFDDADLRKQFGTESKKIAARYSELIQTKKLEAIYNEAIDRKF
ncbi:MAG: glycosyltransferase [Candidatus Saccharimonadales bacterium]